MFELKIQAKKRNEKNWLKVDVRSYTNNNNN